MAEPISPTPRKPTRRGHRAPKAGRIQAAVGGEDEWEEVGDAGEEELFGLLGVVSPQPASTSTAEHAGGAGPSAKGLLAVSKVEIEASSTRTSQQRERQRRSQGTGKAEPGGGNSGQIGQGRNGRQERVKGDGDDLPGTQASRRASKNRQDAPASHTRDDARTAMDSTTQSESDTPQLAVSGRTTPRKAQTRRNDQGRRKGAARFESRASASAQSPSALSAQLAAHPAPAIRQGPIHLSSSTSAPSTSFEMSSMSRSLPTESFLAAHLGGRPAPASRSGAGDTHTKTDLVAGPPGSMQGRKGKGRRKGQESEDESKIWDQPSDPGPIVAQDLTWQQRLGSYPNAEASRSSLSNPTSGSTGKKNKARNAAAAAGGVTTTAASGSVPLHASTSTASVPGPAKRDRPAHARRSSADGLPLSSHTRHISMPGGSAGPPSRPKGGAIPAPPPSAYPLSTFDTLPPFNPAQNVHRAPQTPAKGGLAAQYAVMDLPLKMGQFPRINGTNAGATVPQTTATAAALVQVGSQDGGKYAGASFHNSPHGRALPKPDMEDF